MANGDGWRLRVRPETLADAATPAFLGVRQQHRDVDVAAVLKAALLPGEEMGVVVRQSEDDHVRLAVSAGSRTGSSSCARSTVARVSTRCWARPLPAFPPTQPSGWGSGCAGQDYALTVTDRRLREGGRHSGRQDARQRRHRRLPRPLVRRLRDQQRSRRRARRWTLERFEYRPVHLSR